MTGSISERLLTWGVGFCLVCVAQGAFSTPSRISGVQEATVGSDGLIHIIDEAGKESIAPRETLEGMPADEQLQAAAGSVRISSDRRTVGWIVSFPNCCTSYPLPLLLVLYRDGHVTQRIRSRGLPEIWDWDFVDGGARVVFASNFPHGNSQSQYEMHDVASGRLLHIYTGSGKPEPSWVRAYLRSVNTGVKSKVK